MTLLPGTHIGPYEVLTAIGAGGMGEVYRARDARLNRDVALKVLLPAVANDPDRLARFSREAQILASLNHPNIAHVHGLEEGSGVTALVLELVVGEDLAERLPRGPIPLDEALSIARQIAEALEAAHEQGIVHRDLKPANVKVRGDGTVKVLDFGLAKALEGPSRAGPHEPGTAATLTSPAMMTGVGMILGTAAYMAPEQARGRVVDRRADIWAFGVVLFEMLTGARAFEADDISSTIAFVITREPDWSALPPATPATIRTLLRRCIEKDPKRRLQSIGDARIEIEEALAAPGAAVSAGPTPAPASAAVARPSARPSMPLTIAAALVAALIAAPAAWLVTRPAPPAAPMVTRFTITPPPALPLSVFETARDVAISPDGMSIVYRSGAGRSAQLAIRRLDQLEGQLLTGTSDAHGPFFSADGQWIGFFAAGEIRKVSISGGAAIPLGGVGIGTRHASWNADNTIVYGSDAFPGLLSMSADGRPASLHTKSDEGQHEIGHWFPSFLPGGRGVLFTIASAEVANAQIAVLDLKSGRQKTLIRGGSDAQYVAAAGSPQGYLVYAGGGALRAARFDLEKLEVIGDSVPVVDHVMIANTGEANYAVSPKGTLVYVPGGVGASDLRQLTWVDRHGREEAIAAPPRAYLLPRVSPDGTRLALQISDQERDIWTWDLARRSLTRVTTDPGLDVQPVWTTDGRHIIFASGRRGNFNLFWRAADGTGADEQLTAGGTNQQFANSVTPDGTQILGYEVSEKGTSYAMRVAMTAAPAAPRQSQTLLEASGLINVEMSPDGRYLAYQSDESGNYEVYVRPYPKVNDGRWQVSAGGGTQPLWARDGHELFFLDAAGTLTAVPVQTAGTFSSGKTAAVFAAKYSSPLPYRSYDVSADGQLFLMVKDKTSGAETTVPTITVVLNWTEELKTKLAGR